MSKKWIAPAVAGAAAAAYAAYRIADDTGDRYRAVSFCRRAASPEFNLRGLPWLNFGCGDSDYGGNSVNADVVERPEKANFVKIPYDPPYPFADNSFSAVLASHVLEHCEDWKAVLAELKRICVCERRVAIVLPHFWHPDAYNPAHVWVFTREAQYGRVFKEPGGAFRNPFHSEKYGRWLDRVRFWPGNKLVSYLAGFKSRENKGE